MYFLYKHKPPRWPTLHLSLLFLLPSPCAAFNAGRKSREKEIDNREKRAHCLKGGKPKDEKGPRQTV